MKREHIKKLICQDQVSFNKEMQGLLNIHNQGNLTYHINRFKDGNHMIISLAEKKKEAFYKIQYPFMV